MRSSQFPMIISALYTFIGHIPINALPTPHRKDLKEAELVYASEANLQIPQMVIKFYESKLTWHESTDDSESILVDSVTL